VHGAAVEPHPAVLFCVSSATEVVGSKVQPASPPASLAASCTAPSLEEVASATPPSDTADGPDEQAASARKKPKRFNMSGSLHEPYPKTLAKNTRLSRVRLINPIQRTIAMIQNEAESTSPHSFIAW
jgi:hypothetical protein